MTTIPEILPMRDFKVGDRMAPGEGYEELGPGRILELEEKGFYYRVKILYDTGNTHEWSIPALKPHERLSQAPKAED